MKPMTFAAAALSALALTGVAADGAAADSISYVKGGDVWLATPDGSRTFQVTQTGGYSSASQSDDGTIAALKGQRIHKLDRFGNVLADFSTAVSDGYDDTKKYGVSHFEGPFDVDISPDGRKVAYNFYWQNWTTLDGSTYLHYLRKGVAVSHSDRLTSWEEPGLGVQTGWSDSDWYDADTLVIGHPANDFIMDISTDDLGTKTSDSKDWFNQYDIDFENLRAPAINRQHSRIAVVGDHPSGIHLAVYEMTGEAPALPRYCHGYGKPNGGKFESLTWSPDGRSLAWADGAGIQIAHNADHCPSRTDAVQVLAGARDPDWGPADVPTSRPVKQDAGGGKDSGGGGGGGQQTTPVVVTPPRTTPRGAEDPRTAASAALSATIACRSRCTVTGKVLVPARLARSLKLGRGAIATGTVRRTSKGSARLTLKLTAAGQRARAKLAGKKLTLRVTIKEGRKTRRTTRSIVLR